MDHQPDVRLVDAHPKGVGGCDHTQIAADETLLDMLLGLGRQLGVEEGGRYILVLQKLRHFFGSPARCAVDDGTAGRARWQSGQQELVDMRELLSTGRRHDHELQVGALGAAVKDGQLNAEFVPEVSGDVLHHIGLGGRGQAQDRRDRLLSRPSRG